jgi:hypothetical protein
MTNSKESIRVEITGESEAHCLKIVFAARNAEQPLEIYLHTTQAIDLVHKLSLTICELHHRDSSLLLRLAEKAAAPHVRAYANSHCESCGALLMGGATVHNRPCAFAAIILESFPNAKPYG